jgi:hypothetical protein
LILILCSGVMCVCAKDADTAIYALEETEKSVNTALAALRARMKVLGEASM